MTHTNIRPQENFFVRLFNDCKGSIATGVLQKTKQKVAPVEPEPIKELSDPTEWELVDYTTGRYQEKDTLTLWEKQEIEKAGLNYDKARIIKAKMEEGWRKSEKGYTNKKVATLLKEGGLKDGYKMDTVKKYAAIIRKNRGAKSTPPHSIDL